MQGPRIQLEGNKNNVHKSETKSICTPYRRDAKDLCKREHMRRNQHRNEPFNRRLPNLSETVTVMYDYMCRNAHQTAQIGLCNHYQNALAHGPLCRRPRRIHIFVAHSSNHVRLCQLVALNDKVDCRQLDLTLPKNNMS